MQGRYSKEQNETSLPFDLSREAIQIASKKDKRKAVTWLLLTYQKSL